MKQTTINLMTPIRSERVRDFQPPWRTVYVYRCAIGHEVRVRANSFRGRNATPGVGAIYCPQCEASHLSNSVSNVVTQ